jgi:hypothetical protein
MNSLPSSLACICFTFLSAGSLPAEEIDEGYPDESEMIADPTDPDETLDSSFAQPSAVLPWLQPPGSDHYEDWKQELYETHGLKLGFSYQQLYQWASDTVPSALYDQAHGGWASVTASWTPLNRGQDFEGGLVTQFGWRDPIGNNAVPAQFGIRDTGSLWSNYEFTTWGGGFKVEDLYWQQWLGKDRFNFRVGNMIATSVFNYFRFKDAKSSFTSSPFAFHEAIPVPTYGLGTSFKWWPVQGSELYVVGTLNDMNGDPNGQGLDWSTFGRGEYFYGLEVGYFWRRDHDEFDHLHLNVFGASKRSTRFPNTLPNGSGAGFRVAGEKQRGRVVGFGGYTYNSIEGGGFGAALAEHTGTLGVAYLHPFGIRGETALGLMWSRSFEDIVPGFGRQDQFGLETYWKILLTPNTWITPGVQVILDPAYQPNEDIVVIPHLKFSVSF